MELNDKVLQLAIEFLRRAEGFASVPYEDPKGSGRYSVGYGFRLANGGQVEYYRLQPMSREQADELLRQKIRELAGRVRSAIGSKAWESLTDEQRAALISFAYNVGPTAFASSTVARRLMEGRLDEVPDAMRMWNRAGGRAGVLSARREEEIKLWAGAWKPVPGGRVST